MTRVFLLVSFLALFTCSNSVWAQGAGQQNQINPAFQKYQKTGGELPKVNMQNMNFKTITNNDLKTEGNLFVVIFSPTCGTCDVPASIISQNVALFKSSKVLFITQPSNNMQEVQEFARKNGVKLSSKFFIGIDKVYMIDKLANYGPMPLINVYDKNHKLLKTFNGNVTLQQLKPYIK